MQKAIGLAFAIAFFALTAVVVWNGFPRSFALPYLAGVAAFLVLIPRVQPYFQRRQLEAERELRDTQRLHRPNELVVSVFLTYAQWTLAGLAVLLIAKGVLVPGQVDSGAGAYMFGLVLGLLAFGAAYGGRALRQHMGAWSSMRLRLLALTHRSVEIVVLADKGVGTAPIEVQAEYSRSRGSAGQNRSIHSELLWRSTATSIRPQSTGDRAEFRLRIAIPDDFPRELAIDDVIWRYRWNIKVHAPTERTFNFDFALPKSTVAGP